MKTDTMDSPNAALARQVPAVAISPQDFLLAVAGKPGAPMWTTSFIGNPSTEVSGWAGRAHTSGGPLTLSRQRNAYFSTAELAQGTERRKASFVRMLVLVADDADESKLLEVPSYVIQTSPGKVQIGFVLKDDAESRAIDLCDRALKAMIKAGLVGADQGDDNAVRYVRLPAGCNTKYSGAPAVPLVHWRPDLTYTLTEALAAFGATLEQVHAQAGATQATMVLPAPEARAVPLSDTLTILRHGHNPLAKTWHSDGTIAPYGEAKYFSLGHATVGNLGELSATLSKLQSDPHKCVIRGRYVGDELAAARDTERQAGKVRRANDYFDDQPLHAVMLDIDKFVPLTADPAADPAECIAEFIQTMLPDAFHSAGYHWQLSNSAGHPSKADGKLRAHLWFWLETPRTSAELKAWALATGAAVDKALFNPVQVHYTSAPVMGAGVVDPIAARCGLVLGGSVALEFSVAVVAPASPSGGRGQRIREVADGDEVATQLAERGMILGPVRDGFNIECPFSDGHTPGSGGESSTQYRLPNTGGRALGQFICLHESCKQRGRDAFMRAIGLDNPVNDFEVVTLDAQQLAEDAATRAKNGMRAAATCGTTLVPDSDSGGLLELATPAFSDDRLALEFAARVSASLRWTPGLGWMTLDGAQWGRDDHLHRFDLARSLCREFAAMADKPHERKALASAKVINAVVTLAQSDRRLIVPAGAWDADPFALNTPAGVVDLRTGTMQPCGGTLATRTTSVSPDFAAACPTWLKFIDAVCLGDQALVDFLRRLLGYMLTGDRREQKLFFIWGRGANGKTTLGELLLWLLGGYGLKLSSSVLMQSAHERHPTELAQLKGVRAAISSELEEGQFFNESRVKELTGDDTLSARYMRGDFFEFRMQHKHLVIGNHKPRLKGGDPAMARRLVLIPFRAAFSGSDVDREMPAKLRAEGAAILAWMVRGAVSWHADGLALPASVRAASDEYMADHNDVEQWIEERCERAPDFEGKAGGLYASFSAWKVARGERAPSAVTWAERMALVPGIEKKRSNGTRYVGMRLAPGCDAEEFA